MRTIGGRLPSGFATFFLITVLLQLTTGSAAVSEEAHQDLAKQAQNPVRNLISVPFQNNTNFGVGPNDRTQNVLNFQPVIPVQIADNFPK